MKAILFTAPGDVELTDTADPAPAPDEAVIAVRQSGICHTDTEVLHGNYGTGAYPLVPGHEYAGEIVEIGAEVGDLSVGDRVVVDPNLHCGTCPPCRRGLHNLCDNLEAYGVTRHGGFAQYSTVRAKNLHPIDDMPWPVAALAEPMGCVLTGFTFLRPEPGQRALIFGAGPIGLMIAIALRTRGIDEIHVADVDPDRVTLAGRFGFTGHKVGDGDLEALRGRMHLTADATGRPNVAEGLIGYTASGGRALVFGVCPQNARISVSPFELFRRQIAIGGTHSLNHNIPAALEALVSFGPGITRLVSHEEPLDQIAQILKKRPPPNSLKVQASL